MYFVSGPSCELVPLELYELGPDAMVVEEAFLCQGLIEEVINEVIDNGCLLANVPLNNFEPVELPDFLQHLLPKLR